MAEARTSWDRRQILRAAGLAALGAVLPHKALARPRWREDRPRQVAVIGAGIGGLATGALLAHAGHVVHVLERNAEGVGGHGRIREVGGLRFGMGPQYVWAFEPGDWGARFLDRLGLAADNPFTPMDPQGFEAIVLGGDGPARRVDVPMGLGAFEDRLCELYPADRAGLGALFDELQLLDHALRVAVDGGMVRGSRARSHAALLTSPRLGVAEKRLLYHLLHRSAADWFDLHGLSAPVRRVLYGAGGDLAERSTDASALAYALMTTHYHRGARYPALGFGPLLDGLCRIIREAGGSVTLGAEVRGLVRQGRAVVEVVCADGRRVPCDHVVSDIAPRLTAALLDGVDPGRYRYRPSPSIQTVCLGYGAAADLDARVLGRNIWWSNAAREPEFLRPDPTAPPDLIYIASPAMNGASPDAGDLQGLTCFCPSHVPAEQALREAGTEAAHHARLAEQVVEIIERDALPGSAAHLRFAKVSTSQDLIAEIGAEQGAIYGRRADVQSIADGPLRPLEPVDNLTHVSAAAHMAGIAAGILRAMDVAQELTGLEI